MNESAEMQRIYKKWFFYAIGAQKLSRWPIHAIFGSATENPKISSFGICESVYRIECSEMLYSLHAYINFDMTA